MRLLSDRFVRLLLLAGLPSVAALAQNWEVGGSAGYGFNRDLKFTATSATGTTGFQSGYAFGAVLGNDRFRYIGGDVRYTYRAGDLKVSSAGTTALARGESHAVHYDVLIHAASKEASVRPFLAAGAGARVFRGTGKEAAFQPLENLLVLTHATEAKPLISVGGGVKFAAGRRALLRLDFRDYLTPLPEELLASPRSTRVNGWLHDFVFLVGVSTQF
jgi:hypothetical protein